MGGLATLTLVWLGSRAPGEPARGALARWGAAHEVQLAPPGGGPPNDEELGPGTGRAASTSASRDDQVFVADCERALDAARDQLHAGEDREARATLQRLEQGLRDNPQLLQASFLMAERWRLDAEIAARRSEEGGELLHERAVALEGERALAFGEPASARAAQKSITLAVTVHGSPASARELYWDGRATSDDIETFAGEHHLVIIRGNTTAWAGWVSAWSSGPLDVWVPSAAPCSSEDLAGVTQVDGRVRVPQGVRCPNWVAAAEGDQVGALEVATCSGDHCSPAKTWVYQEPEVPRAVVPLAKTGPLPAWAMWTLAGVGVAAATSLVLWRTGAFDRAEPEQRVLFQPGNL